MRTPRPTTLSITKAARRRPGAAVTASCGSASQWRAAGATTITGQARARPISCGTLSTATPTRMELWSRSMTTAAGRWSRRMPTARLGWLAAIWRGRGRSGWRRATTSVTGPANEHGGTRKGIKCASGTIGLEVAILIRTGAVTTTTIATRRKPAGVKWPSPGRRHRAADDRKGRAMDRGVQTVSTHSATLGAPV